MTITIPPLLVCSVVSEVFRPELGHLQGNHFRCFIPVTHVLNTWHRIKANGSEVQKLILETNEGRVCRDGVWWRSIHVWCLSLSWFKVCKSVHHRTIQINHQPDATFFFSVYYPDVCLQLNMFRSFSRPSSGAQWLQWQPMVLPSYRGDSRAVFVVGPAGYVSLFISQRFLNCLHYINLNHRTVLNT